MFLVWGIICPISSNGTQQQSWCLLLTTGVCGGFTTFSTFANESMLMLQGGNIVGFASYVAICIILGIALTALGYGVIG